MNEITQGVSAATTIKKAQSNVFSENKKNDFELYMGKNDESKTVESKTNVMQNGDIYIEIGSQGDILKYSEGKWQHLIDPAVFRAPEPNEIIVYPDGMKAYGVIKAGGITKEATKKIATVLESMGIDTSKEFYINGKSFHYDEKSREFKYRLESAVDGKYKVTYLN